MTWPLPVLRFLAMLAVGGVAVVVYTSSRPSAPPGPSHSPTGPSSSVVASRSAEPSRRPGRSPGSSSQPLPSAPGPPGSSLLPSLPLPSVPPRPSVEPLPSLPLPSLPAVTVPPLVPQPTPQPTPRATPQPTTPLCVIIGGVEVCIDVDFP